MPAVSIIVPVFNKGKYLKECLKSLCDQTCEDMEIICIDNNSSDNSLDILKEAARLDSRIKVLEESQQGVSFARNTGLDKATGDYVGFIDADDFIDRDYYEKLLTAAHDNDAEIAVCGFDLYFTSEDRCVEPMLPTHSPSFAPSDVGIDLFFSTTPSVCIKLFKRTLIETYDTRFDTDLVMAEDLAFSFSLLVLANRIAVIEEPLYHYRQGTHEEQDRDNKALHGVHVLDALDEVDEFLKRIEADASFFEGLSCRCIDETFYALSLADTFENYKEIFLRFKSDWAPRIAAIPSDKIPEHSRYWKATFDEADTPENHLLRIYHDTREDLIYRKGRESSLEKERDAYRGEVERLRASTTYRVGDVLVRIPRKIKCRLKH